jgi:type I restriction enzyme M protein
VVERTIRVDFRNFAHADYWRALGWKPTEASPVTAAMLAWARLIPQTIDASEAQIFGFFDGQKEVTTQSWKAILGAMRRMRTEHGDSWAFDNIEKLSAKAAPGVLESLRQTIGEFLRGNDDETDKIKECASTLIGGTTEEDPTLLRVIISALQPQPNESVYCGFDLSAPIALELAKHHPIYLQLPNAELAELMAIIAIAANYSVEISRSEPTQGVQLRDIAGLEERRSRGAGGPSFDYSIVLPPFGHKYSRDQISDESRAMPSSSSMADALHINVALERGNKRRLILLADGFLFRTAKNDQIYKRSVLARHGLTSIVSLPRGIIGRDSGVLSSLLVFDEQNTSNEKGVRFVDCRSNWPSKTRRLLNPKAFRTWLAHVSSSAENEHVAFAKFDELAENDFNLLVDRYVIDPELRRQRLLLDRQETVSLDDLAELHRPQVFKPTPENLRPPAGQMITMREVATADIRDGIVERPTKEIDVWAGDVDQIERVILRPGDILISVKGKVGVAGVVPENAPEDIFGAWTAGQPFVIARLRRSTAISNPTVLAHYLASPFGQAQLQALAGGTTVPFIPMADLRRLAIPVPHIDIQRKIVQQIEEIKTLRQQIKKIEANISESERDLSDLFFGDHKTQTKKTLEHK